MDNAAVVAALREMIPTALPGRILAAVRPPLYVDVDEVTISRDIGASFVNLKSVIVGAAKEEGLRAHVVFSEPITDRALLDRCAGWVTTHLQGLPERGLYSFGGVTIFHNFLLDAATEQTLDLFGLLRPFKDRLRMVAIVPGVMVGGKLLFMDRFSPFSSEDVVWVAGDLAKTGKRI